MNRRTALSAFAVALSFNATSALAADPWPTRAVTVVNPVGAGSSSDLMTRIVMDQVSQQLGQPFIIENRPGAGGTTGTIGVLRAPADGYTILSYGALAGAHALYPNLPYDTLTDLTPVAPIGQQPLVIISAPGKYKTAGELIAAMKAKPGEFNYSTAGVGSASHFGAARLFTTVGLKAQHIPFRGAAEAVTDVYAGRSDFSIQPMSTVLPLIRDGKLTALAVMAQARSPSLPDVPSAIEAGLPAAAIYPFYAGVFVSSKTPPEIVDKLYAEIAKALSNPAVRSKLLNIAADPMSMSMAEFRTFFKADVDANIATVKAAEIKIQQ